MESQSSTEQKSLSSSSSKAFCKCGEGWSCVITRTKGADAGKAFFKCGANCCCTIAEDGTVIEEVKVEEKVEAKAFCECGEGWSCEISKIEGPDSGKPYYECSQNNCSCVTTSA